ncbi:MAG: carboxymuconolactone decarboxylase family protein [Proteobacteria bacterium]|nr:MAG: carboxymuconolactone decarboxylase family protein [Pseudomonadota bacterium]
MPLIKPLDQFANAEVEQLVKFYNETLGFCPNSLLTMQHRPAIAEAFVKINKAVMANDGRVTAEQKRLVGFLTSAQSGCRYCQAHTLLAAERYGGNAERLKNIWNFRESSLFTEAEKALFEFALAASAVPNAVDETIEKALKAHWDEGEIVEVLGVIALFGFLNRWNDSMATTLEQPAEDAGKKYMANQQWDKGKHQ